MRSVVHGGVELNEHEEATLHHFQAVFDESLTLKKLYLGEVSFSPNLCTMEHVLSEPD